MPNFEKTGIPTAEEQVLKKTECLDDFLSEIDNQIPVEKDPEVENTRDQINSGIEEESRRIQTVDQLNGIRKEITEANQSSQMMEGASLYAALTDNPEAYKKYVQACTEATIKKEEIEIQEADLQGENGLVYRHGFYQHRTDKEWQTESNGSETVKEMMFRLKAIKEKSLKYNQDELTKLSTEDLSVTDQYMRFRKKNIQDGNYYKDGGAINQISGHTPVDLLKRMEEAYANQFNYQKKYGFDGLCLVNADMLKYVEGITIAALEVEDMETTAKALSFLEASPTSLSPELLQQVKSKIDTMDASKKQEFAVILRESKKRQRQYKEEAEMKSETPLYNG